MKYKTKTVEEIIAQEADIGSRESNEILDEWEVTGDDRSHRIIFYRTEYEDYEGSAFGLSVLNGKLYDFSGGHCSCYGFEGQFSPDPADLQALAMRALEKPEYSRDYTDYYKSDLAVFIGAERCDD